MSSAHRAHTDVAVHPEVPAPARQEVLERLATGQAAEVRNMSHQMRRAEEVERDHRERLTSLMGPERYQQLRSFVDAEKRNRWERLTPPLGPEMSSEEQRVLHRQRQESSKAFLRRLGVDQGALRAVSEETRARLGELAPAPQHHEGRPVMLVLPRDVPADIREGRANPWTVYRPPYPGWSWTYSWWAYGGFSVGVNHFLDSAAGFVGNAVSLTDPNAGDWDVAQGEYQTSIGFWYLMPSAGLVELWVEGQSAAAHHHLSLYDEWWWSDSSVYQYDYLTLKATGASPSGVRTSQMSWFYETGHTDGHWDNHYLCDGCTYWAHLYSDIAFPAGSWVYVEVGTKNTNYAFADDVSVYSTVDFRWFLKSVWVESTGG